ncbi:unnamed protein product [Clavelina lepadiformis]|uniref:Uncharacterized protein n=1 Tax=Clavelina lepadiformis TaxID=159417 RepID=A0ABP0GF24_CLALP
MFVNITAKKYMKRLLFIGIISTFLVLTVHSIEAYTSKDNDNMCLPSALILSVLLGVSMCFAKESDGLMGTCSLLVSTSKRVNVTGTMNKPAQYQRIDVRYKKSLFDCINCKHVINSNTLILKEVSFNSQEVCRSRCSGILCGSNKSCVYGADVLQNNRTVLRSHVINQCKTLRKTHEVKPTEDSSRASNSNQLIVGFAVGGTMLVVVVAGVFFGRTRSDNSSSESEVGTTPVSMSYSEWISNFSNGGRSSRGSNLRVQEAAGVVDIQDNSTVPVYNIVYEESNSSIKAEDENDFQPIIIEVDDTEAVFDCSEDSYETQANCNISRSLSTNDVYTSSLCYFNAANLKSSEYDITDTCTKFTKFDDRQTNVCTSHRTNTTAKTFLEKDFAMERCNNNVKAKNDHTMSSFEDNFAQWSDEDESELALTNRYSNCNCGEMSKADAMWSAAQIQFTHVKYVMADVHRDTIGMDQENYSVEISSSNIKTPKFNVTQFASSFTNKCCHNNYLVFGNDVNRNNMSLKCDI